LDPNINGALHFTNHTMQISKMTDKAQKLAKQLASEKTNSEQLKKSTANQASQHTSENRKLALEISKLKVSECIATGDLYTWNVNSYTVTVWEYMHNCCRIPDRTNYYPGPCIAFFPGSSPAFCHILYKKWGESLDDLITCAMMYYVWLYAYQAKCSKTVCMHGNSITQTTHKTMHSTSPHVIKSSRLSPCFFVQYAT